MAHPGWLEPEEGLNPGWDIGQIVLDKRSGLLMEIVDYKVEILDKGYDWDSFPTDRHYWSFEVVYFDDKTEPADGSWRAPEDLVALTEMEVLAYAAR